MSGCERFGGEIDALVDGELPAGARERLEAHLAGCPECTRAVEGLRALEARLAALPRIEPSPGFEARFRARLAREQEPRRRTWRRRPALALAGAALVLLLWLGPGDPALPEGDWQIVAEADFELLVDADLDLVLELDDLEVWDGSEDI